MLGEKIDGDWETAMVMAVLVGLWVLLMVENDFYGRGRPKRWKSSNGSGGDLLKRCAPSYQKRNEFDNRLQIETVTLESLANASTNPKPDGKRFDPQLGLKTKGYLITTMPPPDGSGNVNFLKRLTMQLSTSVLPMVEL